MKKILLAFLIFHTFYNNAAENKIHISPLTTIIQATDIIFNGLVIHNILSRIPNPHLRSAVSVVTAVGMSASTFYHTYNRQNKELTAYEKFAAALQENRGLIGMKTQNCLYPTAATLPFALIVAISNPHKSALSYTLRTAQWLEKSVPIVFITSYVAQSALIAGVSDFKKETFSIPGINK